MKPLRSKDTVESGFREQPPCRHPRSLNPDWSLNPGSFGSRKSPYQKSEASKSRPASKCICNVYNLQEAPDSYACLHQSAANRTKSTNISKCKTYVQTWCNFQGKRTAGAEIYLNWAIKGTSSFTPPNEIRKNHEAKMCIGLLREVKQI